MLCWHGHCFVKTTFQSATFIKDKEAGALAFFTVDNTENPMKVSISLSLPHGASYASCILEVAREYLVL